MYSLLFKLLIIAFFKNFVKTNPEFKFSKCNDLHCIHSDATATDDKTQAVQMCQQRNTYLLELYDSKTVELFKAFKISHGIYQDKINTNTFLNFEKESSGWKWLNKQGTEGLEIENKIDGHEFAIIQKITNTEYKYRAERGSIKFKTICHAEKESCTPALKVGNLCYLVSTSVMNWWEAAKFCLSEGYNIATFNSMTNAKVPTILIDLLEDDTYYWIGLIKDPFKWIHRNTYLEFSHWSRQYPYSEKSEICPYVTDNEEEWFLTCFSEKKVIVCMSDDSTIPVTIISTTTSTTTTTTTTSKTSTTTTTAKTITTSNILHIPTKTLSTFNSTIMMSPVKEKLDVVLISTVTSIACVVILVVLFVIIKLIRRKKQTNLHTTHLYEIPVDSADRKTKSLPNNLPNEQVLATSQTDDYSEIDDNFAGRAPSVVFARNNFPPEPELPKSPPLPPLPSSFDPYVKKEIVAPHYMKMNLKSKEGDKTKEITITNSVGDTVDSEDTYPRFSLNQKF